MVKRILSITTLALGLLFSSNTVKAQASFTTEADTVWYTVNGASANIYNRITNVTNNDFQIDWKSVSTDFPQDWRAESVLGICDNNLCRTNIGDTAITNGNQVFTSASYLANAQDDFHIQLTGMDAVSAGTHYITLNLQENGGVYDKNMTFIIAKWATNVPNVSGSDEIVLYPNPARGELNVTYSPKAGIKTAAVYNLIGKQLVAYKVGKASAKLNIDNIPSGIYFLRLMDENGKVVATRKFTHQ